jgi:hypothetical protein
MAMLQSADSLAIVRVVSSVVDLDKVKHIVSLTELGEILEARYASGTTRSIAGSDEMARIVHIPGWKTIHGDPFGFEQDVGAHNEGIAVGHAPIHGIPGRIAVCEMNETARIWVIVESARHEQLDVVKQQNGMVNDYRIFSTEVGELKAGRSSEVRCGVKVVRGLKRK